jgi:hypothetical protein
VTYRAIGPPPPGLARARGAETKRLHALSRAALADEIGDHQTAIEALKAEAIRRGYLRFEGTSYRVVLSPPSTSQRTDKKRLIEVLGITAAEFATLHPHGRDRLAADLHAAAQAPRPRGRGVLR